jgi:Rrf2 family nitric oxide-sensitive transcriptional repressor
VKLNLFTDYALRSLMYLSWHRNRTVTAEEIARFYGISRDHIVKVIQELSRHGYVQARRGRGGGSVLARDPRSITVCDVITTFEGTPALLDCLRNSNVCAIERTCKLKQTLSEAQSRMFDYLDTVSVEDIAGEFEPETITLTPSVALNAVTSPATIGVPLPNGTTGLGGPPTPNTAQTN